MKKRIKSGARVALGLNQHGEPLEAVECEGKLCFRVDDAFVHVRCLDAEEIARIQAADLLEDVPEPKTPGQRLTEALDTESVSPAETYYERVAARLGIKPEGE